jgi:hypothetical protein
MGEKSNACIYSPASHSAARTSRRALWSCFWRFLGHLAPVTVSESNAASSTEKFILRALVISLILHLLVFSLWRVGQAQGWWINLAMPRWMQLVSKAMMPAPPKLPPPAEIPSQSQLTFVEVDPAQATTEPPKKALFQGAKNTVAANREIKTPSDMPNLEGRQEQFLKTIPNAASKPAAAPAPPPAPPPAPAPPKEMASQNAPQQALAPGDLITARPSDKPQEGKAKTDAPPAQPAKAQPQPQPAYERPRTIEEALARAGHYGEQTRLAGGVSHISPDTSLDVKGTPLGGYIAHMVDAVDDHWHKILEREHESATLTGRVILRFRLHSDGTVTDMTPLRNDVSDVLETACERGIKEPAPFGKWPPEMRLEIPNDFYDITFTFYYEYY